MHRARCIVSPEMDAITLTTLACGRCGHTWHPRIESPPKVCPKCTSPYWNRPYSRADLVKRDPPKTENESPPYMRHRASLREGNFTEQIEGDEEAPDSANILDPATGTRQSTPAEGGVPCENDTGDAGSASAARESGTTRPTYPSASTPTSDSTRSATEESTP